MNIHLPTYFTKEHIFVLICSRIELSQEQREKLVTIIKSGVDWGQVFKLGLFNKVLPLIASHILTFPVDIVPGLVRRQFVFLYYGNFERNRHLIAEMKRVALALKSYGIKNSPLKGAYLAPFVYQDLGRRFINDVDFLIELNDSSAVMSVMESLGYVMGKFHDPTNEIIPASRTEDIFWKRHIGNIHPYIHKSESPFLSFVAVDFAFDVDPVHKNPEATQKMLGQLRDVIVDDTPCWFLSPEDLLIQVCTHLYKEACSELANESFTRLNLIKFCDFRELLLKEWVNEKKNLEAVIQRANELKVLHALQYCVDCLWYLYQDDFVQSIIIEIGHYSETDVSPFLPGYPEFWHQMFPTISE